MDSHHHQFARPTDRRLLSFLRRLLKDLFFREGYQYDFVFDWTILNYQSSNSTKEGAIDKLEADLKAFVEGLQKKYQDANEKKDKDIEAVKAAGLGLLKSVHAHEKKANNEL